MLRMEDTRDEHQQLDVLANFIRHRREDSGLGIREACVLADMSPSTWTNIEAGHEARGRTYSRVERALHLPPGICRRIATTGEEATREAMPAPVSTGAARMANLIEIVESATDVPPADRMAITATLAAALAHMREVGQAVPGSEREAM